MTGIILSNKAELGI